ncbi:hypothetical protein C1X05_12135 [Laceyella sacchari]|uniref:Uncharacterized protein n=1 Tax=Laceyella tengchongensis TaxID=574699 RepID=A0AA45WLX6_9BACL|nr:hypothetical protein [Laceyella tengchongensis]AUS09490.1 hypothetical protein C1X05_12135 [Laceyella sacchari]SMP12762.1 hypothetical protein SAMN06265361_102395 [Laceyella tengchongensis]
MLEVALAIVVIILFFVAFGFILYLAEWRNVKSVKLLLWIPVYIGSVIKISIDLSTSLLKQQYVAAYFNLLMLLVALIISLFFILRESNKLEETLEKCFKKGESA